MQRAMGTRLATAHVKDERCFPNPHLADGTCKLTPHEGDSAPNAEVPQPICEALRRAVTANLAAVDHAHQTHPPDQSVYTGSAGAAFLHLHLATTLHPAPSPQHTAHLHTALSLLAPSLAHLNSHRSTFLCGAAGPLALAAVCHAHLGQWGEVEGCVGRLKALYTENRPSFAGLPSELLYGHAGFLYALLFVAAFVPSAVEEALVDEVATLLLDAGVKGRREGLPLMYAWHGKHYLGAAHGLAGILTLLLQLPPSSSLHPRICSLVRPCVEWLRDQQFPSGNLPSSLESGNRDRLVQWCHGAPGLVHLMAQAYRVFGDESFKQAAVRCGEVVWERGLAKKGCGLCHGTAGNGFTFLQLFRLTAQPQYVARAVKFAEHCLASPESSADRPFSLFEGLAGTTLYYASLLHPLILARFPALELPCVNRPLAPA